MPEPKYHQDGDPCRHCGGEVRLVENKILYGRNYGKWPYLYLCRNCSARVGVHPDTDKALGSLADSTTTKARKVHKEAFIQVTRQIFKGDRHAAYAWLAEALAIPAAWCHWGLFEVDRCEAAGRLCKQKLKGLPV